MLKKEYRITKQKEFDQFFGAKFKKQQGRSWSTKNLVLKVLKNKSGETRFGFMISKKVDKRAVVRNKLKRQLRSVVKENLKKMVIGYDFLFIVLTSFKDKDYDSIKDEVIFLLQKLKKIK